LTYDASGRAVRTDRRAAYIVRIVVRKSRKGFYVDGEYVQAEAVSAGGEADSPSRTARKNASAELQKVGEELTNLRPELLAGLDLPERLHDAIVEAKRLTNFGAKRRQLQFVGKLMRKLEPAVLESVHAALRVGQPGDRSGPRGGR
jgi:ribosome-associated protein